MVDTESLISARLLAGWQDKTEELEIVGGSGKEEERKRRTITTLNAEWKLEKHKIQQ